MFPRNFVRSLALVFGLGLSAGCHLPQQTQSLALESGHFYANAKPYTRWWWFASEIKKEDVARQLDWFKEMGFGGVEIAWVYPLNIERYKRFYPQITDEERKKIEPRQKWLSPEWSEIVAYAKEYAQRIGLGCDFTFGSAWPFGDSQVPKLEATKIYGDLKFEQRNLISWEYPAQGLILDHLSRPAFEHYAARVGDALSKATHTGRPSALFCDSWEVETTKIWTDGFGADFERRYGYEIQPFMEKIMAPENAGPRYDYLKLVSRYVLENFYRPFTQKSHDLGAFSRVQAQGTPADLLSAYATADVPESEALLYQPEFSRIAASSAALSGKRDVTAESFTCAYGFPREHFKSEQTADLKLIADAIFANGVNHIIWHGAPFRTKTRDGEFYAAVHVGPGGSLASELRAFNAYLEKVSSFMARGRTYSDVAIYLPQEDAWVQGDYPKELQFRWTGSGAYEMRYVVPPAELKGRQPLWVNGALLAQGRLDGGRLVIGDASFAALYIDVEYLDGDALEAILRLARVGLPVCLKRVPKQPGLKKSERFGKAMRELTALANVSIEAATILRTPPLVEGDDLPDFWARVQDGQHYLFFAQPRARGLKMPLG